MKCHICGSNAASIRKGKLAMAKLTNKARIDCGGHSQYHRLTRGEAEECEVVLDVFLKSNYDVPQQEIY